ncbi:MAG: hypothetical protein EBZ60_03700 [Betaproteobacteria bacterium]|nr:hypothetical protein [Betaproteobacteria bacterium]
MIKTPLTALATLLLLVTLAGCSDDKPTNEGKFKPIPEKRKTTPQEEDNFSRRVEAVLNEGIQSQEGKEEAPKASKARPPNSGKEPMIRLTREGMPMGEVVHHSDKLDYFECKGIVAPWFLELVVAEMNYFNEVSELPFVDPKTCILTLGTDKSLTPGRLGIQLFESPKQFERCIKNEECPVFRTVNFVPNKSAIMRSYFLSDFSRRMIQHHCVTDTGKWHRDQTCYTVENP